LDISRLLYSARHAGPGGIDRVELAYAQHFLRADARRPAYAVLHLFGRLYGVNPTGARRFIERLAARWNGPSGDDAAPKTPPKAGTDWRVYRALLAGHWMNNFQLRRRLRQHGTPPIFIVVSHHHLSVDYTIRRIRRFFGARCVCLLHDLIPIDFPEYVQPNRALRHQRATATIARWFDAVITNSQTTADAFRQLLRSKFAPGTSVPTIAVALPGVRAFPRGAPNPPPPAQSMPYFVVLGTIEPKKNHLLLLNLWTRLAETLAEPPRLKVIGARGWDNEQVVDHLERSKRLRGLVEEHNHLDDQAVGALLGDARALLMSSFTEGFGLPVAEALSSGVPVICSDIAAFREVGAGVPEYLDPLDLMAWRDMVLEYARPDSPRRAAQLERLSHWQAPRWQRHFEILENTLDDVTRAPRVCE
jgi:glycosyltransferase involved in cell wall biosynthesis